MVFNSMEQLYYSIRRICEPLYEHVDNHFSPLPQKYIDEFTVQRDRTAKIIRESRICAKQGTIPT